MMALLCVNLKSRCSEGACDIARLFEYYETVAILYQGISKWDQQLFPTYYFWHPFLGPNPQKSVDAIYNIRRGRNPLFGFSCEQFSSDHRIRNFASEVLFVCLLLDDSVHCCWDYGWDWISMGFVGVNPEIKSHSFSMVNHDAMTR